MLRILGQNPTEDEIVEMVMKVSILFDVYANINDDADDDDDDDDDDDRV